MKKQHSTFIIKPKMTLFYKSLVLLIEAYLLNSVEIQSKFYIVANKTPRIDSILNFAKPQIRGLEFLTLKYKICIIVVQFIKQKARLLIFYISLIKMQNE